MTINDEELSHHLKNERNLTRTPVEEFWDQRVLRKNNGIAEGLGAMQWELAGTLLLAWIIVYLIIWKGLHSSGKVDVNMAGWLITKTVLYEDV